MNKHVIEIDAMFEVRDFGIKEDAQFIKRTVKLIDHALTVDHESGAPQRSWQVIGPKDAHGHYVCYLPANPWAVFVQGSSFLYQDEEAWIVGCVGDGGGIYPSAIFSSRDIDAAAEYFVWHVSLGRVKIDWSLFLDDLD